MNTRPLLVAVASLGLPALAQEPSAEPPPPGVPAGAAAASDDTIVIARKREEVLEDVPQSVTVIGAETLDEAGIDSVRDASFLVPNLNVTEFSSRRLSFPFLRGIGSGLGEPAVVTYVDGVPQLTTGSTNLPLVDLDRVEFLRGPQGTLYGRNAIGGVIHLISRRPTRDPRWDAGVTFGEFDLEEYSLSYAGPIGADTLLDFTALQSSRDGYTKNDFTGNRVDDRDAFFGRAALHLDVGERSSLRIGVHGESAEDGGFVLGPLDDLRRRPHRIDQDFEGETERDLFAPSVTYEYGGERVEITSITAFTDWDVTETSDFDFSAVDGVRRLTTEEQEYLYQEVRFASAEGADVGLGDNASLRWLAGVSGFDADSERSAANELRPGLFPPPFGGTVTDRGDFQDEAIGVFGHVTVTFSEKLEIGAGLRFDHESKEADLTNLFEGAVTTETTRDEEADFDEVVPSFSVAYHVDEATTVYGLAAKGFKAGGFNLNAPDEDLIEFDTEESWTYEAGVKRSFVDGKVRLSAALFLIDWEDMQLSQFDVATGGYVENAGESTSRGVEIEAAAEVAAGLDVLAGFGYTDSEFDEFTDSFGDDAEGNDLPFAPEDTRSLGARYRGDGPRGSRWFVRADWVAFGDFYYDPGNREKESYELVNLRAGVSRGAWRFDLFLNNVFDEEYVPIAFQANPMDEDFFVGESGAPRTLGASLRLSF